VSKGKREREKKERERERRGGGGVFLVRVHLRGWKDKKREPQKRKKDKVVLSPPQPKKPQKFFFSFGERIQ
tara:strand:- start:1135 stop:1347 length:213 start_codon:yes stop_codon:yes gene_type:complete